MTFPHKIILHRLGISQKDDKPLQSRAYAVDHAAIMALSLDFGADQWPYETIASGRYTEERRRLLSDQKLPFEQFQPRRLVISVSTKTCIYRWVQYHHGARMRKGSHITRLVCV